MSSKEFHDRVQAHAEAYLETKDLNEYFQLYALIESPLRDHVSRFFMAPFGDGEDTYTPIEQALLVETVLDWTFNQIKTKIHTYNPKYRFSTWSYTIASNRGRRFRKLHAKHAKRVLKSPNRVINIEMVYEEEETENHFHEINEEELFGETLEDAIYSVVLPAIMAMDPKFSTVLIEKAFNNASYQEISAKTNLSVGMVASNLYKGRALLRRALRKNKSEKIAWLREGGYLG